MAAIIVLALHLAIIAFNLAGCVLIPLGAWLGWRWVRGFRWRLEKPGSEKPGSECTLSGYSQMAD